MLLDKFLNENTFVNNTTYNVEVPEPLSEANWITPDSIGLALIKAEDEAFDNRISEGVVFAMNLAEAAELKDSNANTTALLEGVVGDFFSKIVQALKDAWQRMVTWFKNLFKSISVAMVDVKKSLKDVEKVLQGKEFKDFEYDTHGWVENGGGIADKITSGMKNEAKGINTSINATMANLKASKPDHNAPDDSDASYREKRDNADVSGDGSRLKTFISKLVTGSEGSGLTLEQAKDRIRAAYGADKAINGQKGLDWKSMVSFLRGFEGNKVLKEAQSKCNELYSQAITNAENAKKATEEKRSEIKSDAGNYKNAVSFRNKQIRKLQSDISFYKTCLSNYDNLMGTCIDCEKSKFTEYRGIISRAIRYTPKKAS